MVLKAAFIAEEALLPVLTGFKLVVVGAKILLAALAALSPFATSLAVKPDV